MIGLIVRTSGASQFFAAPAGHKLPTVSRTLEELAENLRLEQARYERWRSANPDGGSTTFKPVIAAQVPTTIDTYPGKHAMRPLDAAERQLLAQLTPGFKG